MDDNKKEEKLKDIPVPERQSVNFDAEQKTNPESNVEKRDVFQEDKNISEGLKREIELMQIDDSLKIEAGQKANKIQTLADDDKLKELLRIAKEKGVIYAIQVCKKMNDPYLLDTLHDMLAKEGYYTKFSK